MNKKELAELLDGCEYGSEISDDLAEEAKDSGLVVVFCASDDLALFAGAIDDEIGAWNGTVAQIIKSFDGVLFIDEDDIEEWEEEGREIPPIAQVLIEREPEDDGVFIAPWRCSTLFPYEPFNVMEDGELYCIGIVFDLSEIK